METNLKFNSAVCTSRAQSERLLALGLKKETSDMCILMNLANPIAIPYSEVDEYYYKVVIPAWSLDRLISMINDSYTSEDSKIEFYTKLNRYDEAIALIQSLIHIEQFNKEYLI